MSKIKKDVHLAKMPSPVYDKEYWKDINFQWADSTFLVKNPDGDLVEAGTVLLFRNKIEFLQHLTEEQLLQMKTAVTEAVTYELSKRQ